jgi:acetyl esterase/lipase
MIHNTIEIELDYERLGIHHQSNKATITTYIKEMYPKYQNSFHRPLVIICPGGGYDHHSPREGEAIALKMLDMGMNAVVLRYSVMPNVYPCQLYEAAYTIKYVREHAAMWDVDPNKIIMAGFSAGGHLAASLGTMWNSSELSTFIQEELKATPIEVRPNGMLLGYSVLTSGEFAHRNSFVHLLGEQYENLVAQMSLEDRVTEDTPETFLWHTVADGSVPVENSLLFAQALRKHQVKFELHIFPDGNHGIGLGTKETDTIDGKHYEPSVAVWPQLFKAWVDKTFDGIAK